MCFEQKFGSDHEFLFKTKWGDAIFNQKMKGAAAGIISGGQGPIVIVIAIVESTIALLPDRRHSKPWFYNRKHVRLIS